MPFCAVRLVLQFKLLFFEGAGINMADEVYLKILTMIRAGSLDLAEEEYNKTNFGDAAESEDILALPGRLQKSRAYETTGADRVTLALESARLYENAFTKTGGYYSGINTSAMYLLAENKKKAESVAKKIISKVNEAAIKPGEDAYFALATKAEAYLILGDIAKAEEDLRDAIELDPHNYSAHATTIRQFGILLDVIGANCDWLAELRPPKILHYAGHMITASDDNHADIFAIERMVEVYLLKSNIGVAYGALAAGSDIIIAEKLLAAGVELHIVQPCPIGLFAEKSLAPYGVEWLERFDACIDGSASVRYVSNDNSVLDELTVALAGETAMGLAILRASELATHAMQLLIWDKEDRECGYGTARDASIWKRSGRDQHIIPLRVPSKGALEASNLLTHDKSRSLKALLFSDVEGFSDLNESQVPDFFEYVVKPLSRITKKRSDQIYYMNTWGDGLYLVFDSIKDASETALELQSCFSLIDFASHNLPTSLSLRIGAHYGPTISFHDPFLDSVGVSGTQVSLASRIEPATAGGSVYVTEAFACALVLSDCQTMRCEYIPDECIFHKGEKVKLFALRKKPYISS